MAFTIIEETKEFLKIPQSTIQKIPRKCIEDHFANKGKSIPEKLENMDYIDFVILKVPDET